MSKDIKRKHVQDVLLVGYASRERAEKSAESIVGGDWRVASVHIEGDGSFGDSVASFIPVVEGTNCPCCQQRIKELGWK